MSFFHTFKYLDNKTTELENSLFQTFNDWGYGILLNDKELDMLIKVREYLKLGRCALITHDSAEVRIDGKYLSRNGFIKLIDMELRKIEASAYKRYAA